MCVVLVVFCLFGVVLVGFDSVTFDSGSGGGRGTLSLLVTCDLLDASRSLNGDWVIAPPYMFLVVSAGTRKSNAMMNSVMSRRTIEFVFVKTVSSVFFVPVTFLFSFI